ncbi:MAG: hypothetical protein HKN59_10050 [Gammaproteobacteria bacterium]|nr:hypothetical protein [Gammaproteobacteria bacterium]
MISKVEKTVDKSTSESTDFIPEEVLTRYRHRSEDGWRQILGMTDVLDKAFVELSIAGDDEETFNPYDTSSNLKKLVA